MRVLQVLPSLHVGGVERGVIDLSRAMKKRGEYPVVMSSGGELVGELQKIGVPHYTLPVHKKSLLALSLVPDIVDVIQRERIEIVHARSRVPAWLAWLAARKAGVPFVTTCHGYYSHHPLSTVMGWGKRVIAISQVIGRHMIDDFGVAPERIRLVHRGVDLSQFSYQPWNKREKNLTLRIVNVGRLSPIKGQVEFLKSIHLLKQKIQKPLEVWLVGSEGKGKTKYTELVRKTIKQLDLESCVQLLGTRRDIPELISKADLLVLSTLVPEAFGRVIVEAGAVGTPVIATRLGGLLDIVDSGENGLLVEPGDVKGMAGAMQDILTNPKMAEKFTANLRKKVETEFTLDKMTDETLKVYKEVLPEKKILVIKLGAVGDVILAIPSFRMLRERYPQAQIHVMVDKNIAGLISKSPYITGVIPVNRKKISKPGYLLKWAGKIRREAFDLSIDLQNSKWTHLLAFLAGVPERFGFKRGFFGFTLNRPEHYARIPETPVKNQFRILSKVGVRKLDETLELWSDPAAEEKVKQLMPETFFEPEKRRIGFVMGSSPAWQTKRWPSSYFKDLAGRLSRELECKIVLIGSAEDGKGVDWAESSDEIFNLMGETSLRDLVPLMKTLDVVVTGDTAPLHVAAAVKSRVVALFGPTDSKRHMPAANNATVLTRNLPCQPCYSGTCKIEDTQACLRKISVDEVFHAVRRHLQNANRLPAAAVEK